MDIEQKLFALAIQIWVGTLYQIQPKETIMGLFTPEVSIVKTEIQTISAVAFLLDIEHNI